MCNNGQCPIYSVSQVLVSRTTVVDKMFNYERVEVSEEENLEFCAIVLGPLTEAVHILVETTDSGKAQGECMIARP